MNFHLQVYSTLPKSSAQFFFFITANGWLILQINWSHKYIVYPHTLTWIKEVKIQLIKCSEIHYVMTSFQFLYRYNSTLKYQKLLEVKFSYENLKAITKLLLMK